MVTLNQITCLYIHLEFYSMWNDFSRKTTRRGERKKRQNKRSGDTHTVLSWYLYTHLNPVCSLPEGRNEWLLLILVVYIGVLSTKWTFINSNSKNLQMCFLQVFLHSRQAHKLCTLLYFCFYASFGLQPEKKRMNKWSERSMLIHSNVDTSTFLKWMEAALHTPSHKPHATNHFSSFATLTYLFRCDASRLLADKWMIFSMKTKAKVSKCARAQSYKTSKAKVTKDGSYAIFVLKLSRNTM